MGIGIGESLLFFITIDFRLVFEEGVLVMSSPPFFYSTIIQSSARMFVALFCM